MFADVGSVSSSCNILSQPEGDVNTDRKNFISYRVRNLKVSIRECGMLVFEGHNCLLSVSKRVACDIPPLMRAKKPNLSTLKLSLRSKIHKNGYQLI